MKNYALIALLGTTALMPTMATAQQNDCDVLVTAIEQGRGGDTTVEQARAWVAASDLNACRTALRAIPAQAQGQAPAGQQGQPGQANITVQQPAPTITVDQPEPQITVQQPQPNVTVRQPQPEIIVRQPAPVVTIDIPQPEIIVRMPQPEVQVQQAAPQVQVEQAQPQVQVQQAEQPQVQVQEQGQAQVNLQQPQGQANVQVEQAGQANVTYERAEPQVNINQPQGQPQITVEQMQGGQAGQQQPAGQQQAAAGQQQAGQPAAGARAMPIAIRELTEVDVINDRGEQIGDVREVVRGPNNRTFVIVEHGGFLGLGEKEIAVPVESVWMRGDQLLVPGLTDEQIRQFPEFGENQPGYTAMPEGESVEIQTQG